MKGEGNEETKDGEPKEKNYTYFSPLEFKETKKFKTKAEEFHHGEWRKPLPKTYVTLETEIPEVPAKLTPQPDETTFRKNLLEIDNKINELKTKLHEKIGNIAETKKQKSQTTESGEQSGNPVELKKLFALENELQNKKRKQMDRVNEVRAQEQKLVAERDECRNGIDKQFNTADLVRKGIKDAEKKFITGGVFKNEREYQQRIQFLKDSLPYIQKMDGVLAQLKEVQTKLRVEKEGLPELIATLKKTQA